MLTRNNILLISGLGRDTGKTLLATKIIERFNGQPVLGLKICHHFDHNQHLPLLLGIPNFFEVYEETDSMGSKDSSRMLAAGAQKVYFIQCAEKTLDRVINLMIVHLSQEVPIVCESGILSKYIIPGIHVLMTPLHRKALGLKYSFKKNKKMVSGQPNVTLNLSNYHGFVENLRFERGSWCI